MIPAITLRRIWSLVLLLLVTTFAVVSWERFSGSGALTTAQTRPIGVMGTSTRLVAVVRAGDEATATRALEEAERVLRLLETRLSTWIEASEMSRLNAAPANEPLTLSEHSLAVLTRARELHEATGGAFDITARPVIELWRQADATGAPPSREAIELARSTAGWTGLRIENGSAIKSSAAVQVDVDGLAKGYAIDRALDALAEAGAVGGMAEVGGDLRVFGPAPDGGSWPIGVRSPFAEAVLGTVELEGEAVCTSGAYARPVEIGGARYSHIVDPRTGEPADPASSVTVIAPDAMTADAWATALSILGSEGLELLRSVPSVEALLVTGSRDEPSAVATSGFPSVNGALAIERR